MRHARARFRAAHERGPDLRRGRPAGEHGRHSGSVGNTAGRDKWEFGRPRGQPQQREQPELTDPGYVGKRPSMAAGLDALNDETVGAALGGDHRLGDVGHRHPHDDALLSEATDHLSVRAAERERHDVRSLSDGELDLGGKAVVLEGGRAELDAERPGLRFEGAAVALECVGVDRARLQAEDVQSVRRWGERPEVGNLVGHRFRGQIPGSEEPEPTGARHGGGEFRRRRSAGERRLNDRVLERREAGAHAIGRTATPARAR